MPNQRGKNKVRLGGFVPVKLYRQVRSMAIAEGWGRNVFGFAVVLMVEALERRERKARARKPRT